MIRKILFIRDDDVYAADNAFISFFEFCLAQEIPVIYGVIPKKVSPSLIKLFNKNKKKYPNLIDIAQHGWQHKNYNPDLTRKYEFGPLRNYTQQEKDIKNGLSKMMAGFGNNFTPAFIPPYHGYNLTTLKIINALNYPIFSADKINRMENKRFLDFPALISLNKFPEKGGPLVTDFLAAMQKLKMYLISHNKIVGIVFHHHTLRNVSQLKDMQKSFLLLKKLEQKKYFNIVLFSDILRQKKLLR